MLRGLQQGDERGRSLEGNQCSCRPAGDCGRMGLHISLIGASVYVGWFPPPQVALHHSPPCCFYLCLWYGEQGFGAAYLIASDPPATVTHPCARAQWAVNQNTSLHRRVEYNTGRPVRPVQRQESEVKPTETAK